ncbi:hypothetical protein D3C87_2201320 [compost metagenome]
MGKGVHAGAGGDDSGHADRQFRIADGDGRQELRVEDHLLDVAGGVGDDAGAANL